MSMSRRTLLTSTGAAVVASAALPGLASAAQEGTPDHKMDAPTLRTFTNAANYTVAKLRAVAPVVPGFPEGTKFEKWTVTQDGDWVGGFYSGSLWLAWLFSGDAQFQTLAESFATKLAPREADTTTHDLGFLFTPSWITAWRLTGDPKWRDGAIAAANSLILRFNPAGQFIRAWGALNTLPNAGRAIMDTIMNLDLLWFATQQTGDPKFLNIGSPVCCVANHSRSRFMIVSMMARPALGSVFSAPHARMNWPAGLNRRISEFAAAIAPSRHFGSPVSRHAVIHEGVNRKPRSCVLVSAWRGASFVANDSVNVLNSASPLKS